MTRLSPRQVVELRKMALLNYYCIFGDRKLSRSLADLGLGMTADNGFALYSLHRGRVLGLMIEAAARRTPLKLTAQGRRGFRRWERRLRAEFPRLADDVRRARPQWARYLAEVKAFRKRARDNERRGQ